MIPFKDAALRRAAEAFQKVATEEQQGEFRTFCDDQAYWLDDYALFMALKKRKTAQPGTTGTRR